MRVYRCYFLNDRDGIEGCENIEADALHVTGRSRCCGSSLSTTRRSKSGKDHTACILPGEGGLGGLGSLFQIKAEPTDR